MKLIFAAMTFLTALGCGLNSSRPGMSQTLDFTPIGVGEMPVTPLNEVVRLRSRVVLANGLRNADIPGGFGCQIIASTVDNINNRALEINELYKISGLKLEIQGQGPMEVTLENPNGIRADFIYHCVRPGTYYDTMPSAISAIAGGFLFTRFPRYNPLNRPTNPSTDPVPPPTGACEGLHASCSYAGDSDSRVYTRSGCDVSDAMQKAASACLADGNRSCSNTGCRNL